MEIELAYFEAAIHHFSQYGIIIVVLFCVCECVCVYVCLFFFLLLLFFFCFFCVGWLLCMFLSQASLKTSVNLRNQNI